MLRGLVSPPVSGGGKPLRVTAYTSGTGTYTPLQADSWVRVTVVAGGSSGAKPGDNTPLAGPGGAAGGTAIAWLRLQGPVTYSVGSRGSGYSGPGGSGSNVGGQSIFHTVVAYPGDGSTATPTTAFHVICGGAGAPGGNGAGQPGKRGRMAGISNYASFPADVYYGGRAFGGGGTAEGAGGGAGGDSLYGIGGGGGNGATGAGSPGGAGADATGYGAGGGGGGCSVNGQGGASGNGSGGIIIVEEFGA